MPGQGKVYLIGARAGDPGPLTLRGKACLEEADVVIYDALPNPTLLGHARPEAERIFVGERAGAQGTPQEEINRLLVTRCRAGQVVARLTGGDPFLFGRGGEEAEALAAAGCSFEVVPGVSPAVAAPAYFGIPLTHRWFERKPLFGKTVVVTRAREQAGTFTRLLEEAGAEVLEAPAIAFEPPASWALLDEALARLDRYAWVVFTSANSVRAFAARLVARGVDWRAPGVCRLAAIGPATAEALAVYGMRADRVAEEFTAEGLLAALRDEPVAGKRFLLPRAEVARETLPVELRRRGATVDVVPVYRTVPDLRAAATLREALQARRVAAVAFTSSSTVQNFVEMLKGEDLPAFLNGVRIACIGPVT
ncbi:MAG: uroporphyrinogen-III synthase, partial [candidate division NC10 bacterium]|nr:uroporphyrinogen-III synthase [candidate division NC10 bacterium]